MGHEMNSAATSINILPNAYSARNILTRGRRSSSVDAANDDSTDDVVVEFPRRDVRKRWLPCSFRNGKLHISRPRGVTVRVLPGRLTKKGFYRSSLDSALETLFFGVCEKEIVELGEKILPRIPGKPLVANDIKGEKKESWVEALKYAVHRRYLAVNTADYMNFFVVDCDHDDLDRWLKLGLPSPTWISASPKSGRYHIAWMLKTPVDRRAGASAKAQRFAQNTYDALVTAMNGDFGYAIGALTKNPLHDAWKTFPLNGKAVDIRQIWSVVKPFYKAGARRERRLKLVEGTVGRNEDLFWTVSYYVRPLVEWHRQNGAMETFWQVVEEAGLQANVNGLRWKQDVLPTLRQIWKWTWNHYSPARGGDIDRGAMRLDETRLTTRQKQQMAGPWSGRKNRRRTDGKIDDGLQKLLEQGGSITQQALSEASGVSLRTVKGRWKELCERLDRHPDAMVQNGVYQVVAPQGGLSPNSSAPRAEPQAEAGRKPGLSEIKDRSRRDTVPGQTGLTDLFPSLSDNQIQRTTTKLERHPVTGEIPHPILGYIETVPF